MARALGRQGIPVVAVHHDSNEPCTASRYARVKILPSPDIAEQPLLDFLLQEGRANAPRKGVLLVASDAHWLFVARHCRQLEQFFVFPLPAADDLKDWPSKPFQYAAAARAGVPFPRTVFPRHQADVEAAARELAYPCLIKPVLSHIWMRHFPKKLAFIQTPQQLVDQAADAFSRGLGFMIQEYIPSEDDQIYGFYSYLDRTSRPLGIGVSRKIRQFEPRFGNSCYSISVREPRVEELGLRLVQSIGFHGISSVEFKRDPRDGEFKLMEINLRAPLMIRAVIESGVNLPYLAYCDLCGQPPPAPRPERVGRRIGFFAHDIHTARLYRSMGKLSFRKWILSWMQAQDIHFAWDDLRPMRGYLKSMLDHWRQGRYRLAATDPAATAAESPHSRESRRRLTHQGFESPAVSPSQNPDSTEAALEKTFSAKSRA